VMASPVRLLAYPENGDANGMVGARRALEQTPAGHGRWRTFASTAPCRTATIRGAEKAQSERRKPAMFNCRCCVPR